MTKRQLIDEIVAINQSAKAEFLARFGDVDLGEYLSHLRSAREPRLTGDSRRFDRYFRNVPVMDHQAAAAMLEHAERRALLGVVDHAKAPEPHQPEPPPLDYQPDAPGSRQRQAAAPAPVGALWKAPAETSPASSDAPMA
jgi:hypothetical protein